MKQPFFLIFSFLLGAFSLAAQQHIVLSKTYHAAPGAPGWAGRMLRELPGGDLIIVGDRYDLPATAGDIVVMRTNANGDIIWTYTWVEPFSQRINWGMNNAVQIIGEEIFIIGMTYDPVTLWDPFFLKISTSGNLLWARTKLDGLGGASHDFPRCLRKCANGDWVISGLTFSQFPVSPPIAYNDVYFIRLTSDGAIIWQKSINIGGYDEGYSILELPNLHFLVTGQMNNDVYFAELDSDGTLLVGPTKIYDQGNLIQGIGYNIEPISTGGYMLCGRVWGGIQAAFIAKLDANLDVVWEYIHDLPGGQDNAYSLRELPNNEWICNGETQFDNGKSTLAGFNYWVFKFTDPGNSPPAALDWEEIYGGTSDEWATSLEITEDGGFIMNGISWSNDGDLAQCPDVGPPNGVGRFWVLKINECDDENSNDICDCDEDFAVCKNITVGLDATGNYTLAPTEIDDGSLAGCDPSFTRSLSKTTFNCSNIGPNLVTLSVANTRCGTGTCQATVTVVDNQPPSLVCANAGTLVLTAPEIYPNFLTAAQINSLIASVSDNCSPLGSLVKTVSPPSFSCSSLGLNNVIVTVVDAKGNSASCPTVLNVLAAPTNITVGDKIQNEGNPSGTTNVTMNISRTHAGCPTTVNWITADGTATAANLDYCAASGTLTIPFGYYVGQVVITTKKDQKVELDEAFSLNISNAINGTITDPTGMITLKNDDHAVINVANISTGEGNTGLKTMYFTASLNNPVDVPITFNYTTADMTATLADNDYVACTGCLATIPACALSAMFAIQVVGDTKSETNEKVDVNLTNLNASGRSVTLANHNRNATIQNDDGNAKGGSPNSLIGNGNAENGAIPFETGLLLNDNDRTLVFPNPTRDVLLLTFDGMEGDLVLEQRDVLGKIISTQKVAAADGPVRYEVGNWPSGIYFLSIENLTDLEAEKQVIRWVKAD